MSSLLKIGYYCLLGVSTGCCISAQATILAEMSSIVGHTLPVSFVSFTSGIVFLVIAVWSQYAAAKGNGTLEPINWEGLKWWELIGGFVGAGEITARAYIVSQIGLTPQTVCNISGQMLSSLVLDHIGFLGLPQKPFGPLRAAGVVSIMLGCFLASLEKGTTDKPDASPTTARVTLMATAMVAGSCLPVQAAVNRRLGTRLPPCYYLRLPATLVSFATGWVLLACVLLLMQFAGLGQMTNLVHALPSTQWYHYTTGLFGLSFVCGGIVISPVIGVGGFLACGMLGQLSLGMLFDALGVVGRDVGPPSAAEVTGTLMVLGGAAVICLWPLPLELQQKLVGHQEATTASRGGPEMVDVIKAKGGRHYTELEEEVLVDGGGGVGALNAAEKPAVGNISALQESGGAGETAVKDVDGEASAPERSQNWA